MCKLLRDPPAYSSMVYVEGRCKVVILSEADAEGVLTWIKTLEPYTSMLAMWTTAKDTVNAEIRDLTRRKRRYETNLFITPIALGHHYTLCSFANYGKQLMVEWYRS